MKRKTTIAYAMAVVIAGLLITSAAGLTRMKEVTRPVSETENTDADLQIAALLERYGIDPDTKQVTQTKQKMTAQKTPMESQVAIAEGSDVLVKKSQFQTPDPIRQPHLVSHAVHPAKHLTAYSGRCQATIWTTCMTHGILTEAAAKRNYL